MDSSQDEQHNQVSRFRLPVMACRLKCMVDEGWEHNLSTDVEIETTDTTPSGDTGGRRESAFERLVSAMAV